MNADKMMREELDGIFDRYWGSEGNYESLQNELRAYIEAIQSAPFVPDWSLKPEGVDGFLGMWTTGAMSTEPGEFYIPAPSNPSDAELSAMFNKFDRDKRVQILRDAGVEV